MNTILRRIPEQPWYLNWYLVLFGVGLIPLTAICVQYSQFSEHLLVVTKESQYANQSPSALVMVFITLSWVLYLLIVAEVAVISTYVQLYNEDYHWWWRAFFLGATPSFYMFWMGILIRAIYPLLH